MDKGRIVRLVLIPIIIGLVVTLIVRQLLSGAPAAASADAVETIAVVVVSAKETVPTRTKLSEQHVALKPVPKAFLSGNEFTALQDVVGQISTIPLEPGELVLKTRVVPEGKGALPYRIPAGTRAMTIRIDELAGVAGHPEPGDLVDLLLVLPSKAPDRPATTSRILYESVLVLGKGPAPAVKSDGTTAVSDAPKLTSLTLALSPDAAVEVALAEQIGHVKVMLRPALKEGDAGKIITSETRYNGAAPAPAR